LGYEILVSGTIPLMTLICSKQFDSFDVGKS
jgi:hypothetical protein